MPKIPIEVRPGIVTEETARGGSNRYKLANRVRFYNGHPEKLGGWLSHTLAGDAILGVPRGNIEWRALSNESLSAFGTNLRLYLIDGGAVENITPYRLATDEFGASETELTDPFDTTDTESIVLVTHAAHGAIVGDTVYFANADAVGGLTIDGEYQILTTPTSGTYTIDAGSAATSTVTGGGTVDFGYEINIGNASGTAGLGWGVGGWGEGTWNTPRTAGDLVFPPRIWSFATWGEDLIANPVNGGIYVRDTSVAPPNRAALIAAAPAAAAFIGISPIDRHLFAYGCTPIGGSVRDPLVLRWCSQNDYTDWTPTRTNTSGERRISDGSALSSAINARTEQLIFTDTAPYVVTFIGPPETFQIRQLGSDAGIAGPLVRAEYAGRVYWMSQSDFFVYDGSLNILPCPIHNHVFNDINLLQGGKFHCGVSTEFHEIFFFYVSADATEIDRYVSYDVLYNTWSMGELERTTWFDNSEVRSKPAAFNASAVFYDHETGATDDGSAMGDYLDTWDFEIDPAGEHVMFIEKLVPDFLRLSGTVQVTFTGKLYPNGDASEDVTKGPFDIVPGTKFVKPRLRARQISMRIASDPMVPATDWRTGTWLGHARPQGRR